ncbi:MAG TPA: queuosine precursor transporter [Pyrinomonadaceae bacterium]|jgi:uncharacterized integral membrane protein (TIGR00697 family)|nr:queuosine precursor transporter [Pyrinomonadaceae bacterium]
MRVFLSHSSNQKSFVKEVRDEFPSWISSWLDDDNLLAGEDLTRSLEKAILTECNFLIVFVSNDAAHSEWVRREVDWAKQRQDELSRIFVLPVLMNCEIDRLDELGLKDKKAIIMSDELSAKEVAQQLVHHISAHCAQLLPTYTSTTAQDRQRLKTYLLAAYVALLVAAAAGGNKVMNLGFPLIWFPAAGVTVIPFAFTFLITDSVNELFGQKEAQRFVIAGFMSLLLATGFMYLFAHIPIPKTGGFFPVPFNNPTEFYIAYKSILSPPVRIFVAGLIAYLVGQFCNIWIFDWIRDRTTFEQRGRRNVIATLVSQVIDTLIFVFGAFYKVEFLDFGGYSMRDIARILTGQFLVKAVVALGFSYPAFLRITKKFSERAQLTPPIG